MKCLYCAKRKTAVTNSREVKGGTVTWRRRTCLSCGKTFTTKESAVADNLFVIKRNGSRQRFVYEKLFASIFAALHTKKNSDNGDNAKRAKKLSAHVIEKVYGNSFGNKDVRTSALIILIYKELKKSGQLYADHYIYYSDFRLQTAMKEKLVSKI